MDIRHLRYFVTVAEALSFAKAARNLHMSQPPLSRRIADMEGELGIRLFDRSTKKVTLTATGQRLLPQARAAVQAFDSVMRAARAVSPSQSRRLRIALLPETSRSVLHDVVSKLERENVEVNISEASTSEQQRLLAAGEIDVGLLHHPFDVRGSRVSAPLAQSLGVLMHSKHPLASRKVLRLSDLQPYALLIFPHYLAPGLHDEILQLCRNGGYVPSKLLHGLKMTAELLITEQAVMIAAERLLKRRGQAGTGELIWKPLDGSPIHWWTSVVCRSQECGRLTRMAMSIILDSLQQHEHWIPMPRPGSKRRASSTQPDSANLKHAAGKPVDAPSSRRETASRRRRQPG